MGLQNFVKAFFLKLYAGLKRFPEAIVLVAGAAALWIALNHIGPFPHRDLHNLLNRVAMVLALGFPLFLALRVLWERFPGLTKTAKLGMWLVAGAALIFYYLYLLPEFNMVNLTRYAACSIFCYLVFICSPYFPRKAGFERYVIHLLLSFVVAYFYAAVLYLGFIAILFTVSKLFTIAITWPIYADLWLVVAVIFAPLFFLADLPQKGEKTTDRAYPKVLTVLLLDILMPLLGVYSLILYVYFAKITIIDRSWPIGIVAGLVLWYALMMSLVIFLAEPLRACNKWARTFIGLFPKLMLPLLGMMFIAMGIRFSAYGITESRYFAWAAGIWATGAMIYVGLRKTVRNNLLGWTAALFVILAVFGPWSSYSIAIGSQNKRFVKLLHQYRLLQGKTIVKPLQPIPNAAQTEISAILSYFKTYHHLRDLKYLPAGFEISQAKSLFGFETREDYVSDRIGYPSSGAEYFIIMKSEAIPVKGYDYLVDSSFLRGHDLKIPAASLTLHYETQSKQLIIRRNAQLIYSVNVTKLAAKVLSHYEKGRLQGLSTMTIFHQNDQVKTVFVFKSINGSRDESSGSYYDFYLLIKLL